VGYKADCAFVYIQTQLCEFSLADWLKLDQNQSKNERERQRPRMKKWFKQIVSAVEHIHSNNINHRDLKVRFLRGPNNPINPGNILYMSNNSHDVLKLCDLGIATTRHYDDDKSVVSRTCSVGTPLYMSPEQRDFPFKYSSKSDVFSLGLILIELWMPMTGERVEIFGHYQSGSVFPFTNDGHID
ncbi:hypothetical protein PMAYCL1PPCAC_05176, partial [Pristionchus mayeri]